MGDAAMNARQYDAAISQYSGALSLGPAAPHALSVKRNGACAMRETSEDALHGANEA